MESTLSIIISIVFSTLAGIISGAVLFFVKRFFKKKELVEHVDRFTMDQVNSVRPFIEFN